MTIRELESKVIKSYCDYWNNEFRNFMNEHPEGLKALSIEVKMSVKNDFDFSHMFVPDLKKGYISGYHIIDAFPEAVLEVKKVYPKSVDVIVGVENTVGRLFPDNKTLFSPGTTEKDIIQLFYDACMTMDKSADLRGGSIVARSKKINGQWYEVIVDQTGVIKTFYPTNQEWKY